MKKLVLVLSPLLIAGCVDGGYGGGYGYPSSGYPSSGYPSSYPSTGYPPPVAYPPAGYPSYPSSGGYNYPPPQREDHNRCGGNKRCGGNDRPRDVVVAPPPPPPPVVSAPQPSCPSGTVLDGRGCRITDSSKPRPGGDGYINPCSNGYYSGGRCVSN